MSINIADHRLLNQGIKASKFEAAKDIVRWMGAMQAQDYPMAKWAVGVRLRGATDKMVEAALDKGEILRTHLLRPTWHFVSADDIYWMLELSRPQIIASMKFREKWLGLTKAILAKSNRVIQEALSSDRHLTREELIAELNKAKIRTDQYRSGHLLMRAELDGIICSGKVRGNKLNETTDSSGRRQTYALLEKRVPNKRALSREESLNELAQRYFSSCGPATVKDFAWWSGLSMADARNALEMIRPNFVSEVVDGKTFWFPNSFTDPPKQSSVLLLPAFDEFLIAYKDRSAAIHHGVEKQSVSENGVFRSTIVVDGLVTGLWKRTVEKDSLVVETKFFREHTKNEKREIQRAMERFARFRGFETIDCKI